MSDAAAMTLARDCIVIVGGPGRGKSTLAAQLSAALAIPLYCTDMTDAPTDGVTYLLRDLSWSEGSQYVADSWLTLPAPWIVWGIATVRAMRKLIASGRGAMLGGVRVLHLRDAVTETTEGQERTAKAVATIWAEIAPGFAIVSPRTSHGTPEELRYVGAAPNVLPSSALPVPEARKATTALRRGVIFDAL